MKIIKGDNYYDSSIAKAPWEKEQVELEQGRKKAWEVTQIASELYIRNFLI